MSEHSDDRLYGVPGAEEMHVDLAGVYECQVEPWVDEHDSRPHQIEEWTAVPLGSALPSADVVIEWAAEMAYEDVGDGAAEAIDDPAKDPEVVRAFAVALDLWASKIKYRMASRLVRTWEITWDPAGEPLADGEPIYQKRQPVPDTGAQP